MPSPVNNKYLFPSQFCTKMNWDEDVIDELEGLDISLNGKTLSGSHPARKQSNVYFFSSKELITVTISDRYNKKKQLYASKDMSQESVLKALSIYSKARFVRKKDRTK